MPLISGDSQLIVLTALLLPLPLLPVRAAGAPALVYAVGAVVLLVLLWCCFCPAGDTSTAC